MTEAALEEVSVLSAIYCGEGEFKLIQQSVHDGIMVQISSSVGGHSVNLLFHMPPGYPTCPPDISVSSPGLSRTQCHSIRQKLLDQAAALPPDEPMVHQLVECLQNVEVTEAHRGREQEVKPSEQEEEEEEEWTTVLALDHMRSRNRYITLLERWSKQLHLTGTLLLGRNILIILQGSRASIKEFCCLLKTVKVDVDSSGKKCKERMMKVLTEVPSLSSHQHRLQGFVVKDYQSASELNAAFQEVHMMDVYEQILPSLRD